MDGYKKNPEKLSIAKVGEHIPSRFSISMILPFTGIKNKKLLTYQN